MRIQGILEPESLQPKHTRTSVRIENLEEKVHSDPILHRSDHLNLGLTYSEKNSYDRLNHEFHF